MKMNSIEAIKRENRAVEILVEAIEKAGWKLKDGGLVVNHGRGLILSASVELLYLPEPSKNQGTESIDMTVHQ